MKDSRVKSFVEAVFNIVVGITISFIANIIIFPLFGFQASLATLGWIAVIYTFISLARSYLIRRLFVHGFYEFIRRKNGTKNKREI